MAEPPKYVEYRSVLPSALYLATNASFMPPFAGWVALEVGTDGIVNHVDRELGDPELEAELIERISRAFWKKAERQDMRRSELPLA